MSIILSGLAYQPIAFNVPEGNSREAKCINSGPLVFTGSEVYILDPTQSNQLLDMQNIQGMFVDNVAGAIMRVEVIGTGQIVRVQQQCQGYYPLICSDRPVFQISMPAGVATSQIWFLNTPVIPMIWQPNSVPNY